MRPDYEFKVFLFIYKKRNHVARLLHSKLEIGLSFSCARVCWRGGGLGHSELGARTTNVARVQWNGGRSRLGSMSEYVGSCVRLFSFQLYV